MASDLHPVKNEEFDTAENINIDPKGFHRRVDIFRSTDFGLYMARGADHPRFGYLESWLLPSLGLRANIFHFRPGVDARQDFYIDVVDVRTDAGVWHAADLYVDLVSVAGEPLEILDIDELAAACSAGLITAETAARAMEITLNAVEGITRHNDDPMQWFRQLGMDLTWADQVNLSPAS